jgi:hypothetical protein
MRSVQNVAKEVSSQPRSHVTPKTCQITNNHCRYVMINNMCLLDEIPTRTLI